MGEESLRVCRRRPCRADSLTAVSTASLGAAVMNTSPKPMMIPWAFLGVECLEDKSESTLNYSRVKGSTGPEASPW